MARPTLPSVETTVDRLRKLLKKARKVKTATTIEPALPVSEFSGDQGLPLATKDKNTQYAIIEVAARQLFHEFVVKICNHSKLPPNLTIFTVLILGYQG